MPDPQLNRPVTNVGRDYPPRALVVKATLVLPSDITIDTVVGRAVNTRWSAGAGARCEPIPGWSLG